MRAHRRSPHDLLLGVLSAATFVLAACGGDDGDDGDAATDRDTVTTVTDPPETSAPETTAPHASVPAPSTPAAGSGPSGAPGSQLDQAVADLAAREGVEPAAIEVVSEEAVTWSDGSLGCPEEGMLYTQALVEGVRIVLELDGTRYSYHAGHSDATPFYCPDPQPPLDG